MSKLIPCAVLVLSLATASGAFAAVVRTSEGAETSGDFVTETFHLRTENGQFEVPAQTVLQIRRSGNDFELLLADGSKMVGALLDEELRLKVGLVVQVVPTKEVDVLMLTPAGFPVGVLQSAFFPSWLYRGRDVIERCPIRFEFDVAAVLGSEAKQGTVPKTRLFACDSLSVATLALAVKRSKKTATIDVDGVINVLESFDKWARVTLELVQGDRSLAKAVRAPIDAEERKTTPFSLRLQLSPEALDEALRAQPPLLGRVTVEVGRNGDVEYLQVWGVKPQGPHYDGQ